jgi:hypothetical protein
MNRELSRVLVRLYPRSWRERYGAEFEALLEDGSGGFGAALDVLVAALWERVWPTMGGDMAGTSRFERWSARAPWAVFGIVPLVLLAAVYCLAFFILWSGWRMFLPLESTPFVRVDGWGVAYFGAGRLLYIWSPLLVGVAIAWTAARPSVKALWPVVGMVLIAWIGGAAHVRVNRPTLDEPGHVGVALSIGHPGYAPYVLALSLLVYSVLRMLRGRVRTA